MITDAADRPFHYLIPAELEGKIIPGSLVAVPFGRRQQYGYVTALLDEPEVERVRPVEALLSPGLLSSEQLALIFWLAERYYCRTIEALRAIIPAGNRRGEAVRIPEKEKKGLPEPGENSKPHLRLTLHQQKAIEYICSSADGLVARKVLLHGVTGSGKTEVYLRAIRYGLDRGRKAVVLIPEISLTPQMIERFQEQFSGQLAVLHSRLTPAARSREWERIKAGQATVVLGARSAIFAPLSDIGLIIIDEEHENSYKQEEAPRYHAREVAWWRARYHRAVLVLGSATPSLESYYETEQGHSVRLSLPFRVKADLPPVQIVDMRTEILEGHRHIFSRPLQAELKQVLSRGEQAILFLNRRGFASFILCRECGFVVRCPRCQISLTIHLSRRKMICHYCSYEADIPHACPNCGGIYIRYQGVGTERVEKEVRLLYPGQTVIRMDSDTTSRRGSHGLLYRQFRDRKASILIGTQMIAKGLDFPAVTLVGVITADTALNLPDFRAGERTFQLLTQVSGRSGRGPVEGKVIIQTYHPQQYCIKAASRHDYTAFYRQEMERRQSLEYPPFGDLVRFLLAGEEEKPVWEAAGSITKRVEELDAGLLLGPAPAPLYRLKDQYRLQVILRGKDLAELAPRIKQIMRDYRSRRPPWKARLTVDFNPLVML